MSSYIKKVIHPKTGKVVDALYLDDHYGSHEYGVGFRKDGKDFIWHVTPIKDLDFYKPMQVRIAGEPLMKPEPEPDPKPVKVKYIVRSWHKTEDECDTLEEAERMYKEMSGYKFRKDVEIIKINLTEEIINK